MPRSNWQRVAEFNPKEGACVRVWMRMLDPGAQAHQPAWGAFTLTQGDTVEVFVFAEGADSESSSARASDACLDACDF